MHGRNTAEHRLSEQGAVIRYIDNLCIHTYIYVYYRNTFADSIGINVPWRTSGRNDVRVSLVAQLLRAPLAQHRSRTVGHNLCNSLRCSLPWPRGPSHRKLRRNKQNRDGTKLGSGIWLLEYHPRGEEIGKTGAVRAWRSCPGR